MMFRRLAAALLPAPLVALAGPCDSLSAEFQFTAQGTTVIFTPNVFDNTWGYHWDFGDGTSDWSTISTHIYPGPTVFQACLTVWAWDPLAQDSCFATSCQIIDLTAGNPCAQLQAGFFANTFPQGAQFSNATTGTGLSTTWNWDFGDGSTSTDAQPLHNYALPGTYTVCLTAISIYQQPGGGVFTCVDTLCEPVTVPGTGSPCDSLSAEFQFTAQGTTVIFTPNVFDNTWGYHWDFGDGTSDWSTISTHIYPGPTVFQACLTVWAWDPLAQDSCFATSCQIIDLTAGNPCAQLQAGFFANTFPQGAQFSNATTGTGLSTTWNWDFGDGSTSTDAQPLHNYALPGTYTVCLTAISIYQQPGGGVFTCVDTLCEPVTVPAGGGCDSTYVATFTALVTGSAATFAGASTLPSIGWLWDFGDGSTGGGQSTQHVFPGPGAYYTCLSTWYWEPLAQDTCWASYCQWISIASTTACDSLFVADFVWTGVGMAIAVQNSTQANGPILSVTWDFGDGTVAMGGSGAHTYAAPGTYPVCMTVVGLDPWAQDSCIVTHCENVLVGGLAIGDPADGPAPTLAPQPFTERLVVAGISGPRAMVELVDGMGRVVLRGVWVSGSELELNTSGLAPGAYTVLITSDGHTWWSRALKAWR